MISRFQSLRDPPTGRGVEAGTATAATWQWYGAMDAALQGHHSICPPLVVASRMTATTGGVESTPASTSSAEEAGGSSSRKRPRDSLLELLREQGERDEERERQWRERRSGRGRQQSGLNGTCPCLKNVSPRCK